MLIVNFVDASQQFFREAHCITKCENEIVAAATTS